MKVTICGAQGVGKTTIVEGLPEKWQKYVVKKVIRDMVLKNDMNVNESSDAYSQTEFFKAYLRILTSKQDYITDRGLIDVLAYTKYLVNKKKMGVGMYWYQKGMFQRYLETNPECVFLYVPIEFEIEDDGFRSVDKKYQKEIASAFMEVFEDLKIEPLTIRGTVEKRIGTVEKLLESIEKGHDPKIEVELEKPKRKRTTKKTTKNS